MEHQAKLIPGTMAHGTGATDFAILPKGVRVFDKKILPWLVSLKDIKDFMNESLLRL